MFGFGLSGKIAAGAGVVILAMSGAFYLYYNHTQERLEEQSAEIATYKTVNRSLQNTINKKDEELSRQIRNLNELNEDVAKFRRESNELSELLARHDLKYLAAKKPGLIENRVNRGTQDVFDKLKDISDPDTYNRADKEKEE